MQFMAAKSYLLNKLTNKIKNPPSVITMDGGFSKGSEKYNLFFSRFLSNFLFRFFF